MQDDISRAIVEALRLRLGGEQGQVVAPTKNLEAYTHYLKDRFFFAKLSEPALRRSLDLFQQALLQDPALARAYAGIADAWCNLADDWVAPDVAYPRAKGAAERALQREPQLAEAMTSLGKVLGWHEWKFADAEAQLARAVSIAPNYAEAQYVHCTLLPSVGRVNDAIDTMRKALVLDPLAVHDTRGWRAFSCTTATTTRRSHRGHARLRWTRSAIARSTTWGRPISPSALPRPRRRGQSLERAPRARDAAIVRALAALEQQDEADETLARLDEESRRQSLRAPLRIEQ